MKGGRRKSVGRKRNATETETVVAASLCRGWWSTRTGRQKNTWRLMVIFSQAKGVITCLRAHKHSYACCYRWEGRELCLCVPVGVFRDGCQT